MVHFAPHNVVYEHKLSRTSMIGLYVVCNYHHRHHHCHHHCRRLCHGHYDYYHYHYHYNY